MLGYIPSNQPEVNTTRSKIGFESRSCVKRLQLSEILYVISYCLTVI